jgi:hypothetical protein
MLYKYIIKITLSTFYTKHNYKYLILIIIMDQSKERKAIIKNSDMSEGNPQHYP